MRARSVRGLGSIEERRGYFYWRRSRLAADGTRKQWRSGPYATREEAEAARSRQLERMTPPVERVTWEAWFDRWLRDITSELEVEGSGKYAAILERYVRLYLRPNLAGPMASTTSADLDALWAQLRREGLAHRYVANIRFGLNKAVVAAVRDGLISHNPVTTSVVPLEATSAHQ